MFHRKPRIEISAGDTRRNVRSQRLDEQERVRQGVVKAFAQRAENCNVTCAARDGEMNREFEIGLVFGARMPDEFGVCFFAPRARRRSMESKSPMTMCGARVRCLRALIAPPSAAIRQSASRQILRKRG